MLARTSACRRVASTQLRARRRAHSHTHEHLDSPGEFSRRETGLPAHWRGRDWRRRAFTVGIGDIVATNDAERIYCVVVMTVGTMVFTYGITSVVQAISNRNRAQKVFNEQLDELNTFMADRKLPRPMRHALREYFRTVQVSGAQFGAQLLRNSLTPLPCLCMMKDSALIYDERSLLAHTSPALAGQVVEHVHAQALRKVPFFADASNECFVDIAMRLQRRLFTLSVTYK